MAEKNLTVKDIINNAIDELQRAKDIISNGGERSLDSLEDHEAELFDDIDMSIERLSTIENTILVALVAAVYAGNLEAEHEGFMVDFAESLGHLQEYLAIAEQYDSTYTADSEDMRNDIYHIIEKKYRIADISLPTSVTINASDLVADVDDYFETEEELVDIVSEHLSDTYGYCHKGFSMKAVFNEKKKLSSITVTNIQWDTKE